MLEQEVGGHVDVVVGCSESFLSVQSGETHLHQPRHLDTKRIEAEFRKSYGILPMLEMRETLQNFTKPSTLPDSIKIIPHFTVCKGFRRVIVVAKMLDFAAAFYLFICDLQSVLYFFFLRKTTWRDRKIARNCFAQSFTVMFVAK